MSMEDNNSTVAGAAIIGTELGVVRGWTNYTPCFTPELHDLMRRLNETGNAETILDIAARTRVLEYVGLSVSLVALLVSLGIFFRFRWVWMAGWLCRLCSRVLSRMTRGNGHAVSEFVSLSVLKSYSIFIHQQMDKVHLMISLSPSRDRKLRRPWGWICLWNELNTPSHATIRSQTPWTRIMLTNHLLSVVLLV